LKAVRHAVESFLTQMAGRNVLFHEDNHAVCHILTCMTSRSPRYDGWTTTLMVPNRHKQHHHHGTLHYVSSQRLDRQALSTPRQRRLETRPGHVCGTRHEIWAALVLELGTDTCTEVVPAPQGRRLWRLVK
jgi:hypothetical protein